MPICCALAALTLWAFWPLIHCGFINFDDPDYVTGNPRIQAGITWMTIKWAFTTVDAGNWHPVTWLSHALDWQLFGGNAAAHHLMSLAIHLINSVLVFLVLLRLTGATWRPAAVAALFAVHPAHVESVAWISERKDVLSTFFGFFTLLAYAKYAASVRCQGKEKFEIRNPRLRPTPARQANLEINPYLAVLPQWFEVQGSKFKVQSFSIASVSYVSPLGC